jgi:hypothetical protein
VNSHKKEKKKDSCVSSSPLPDDPQREKKRGEGIFFLDFKSRAKKEREGKEGGGVIVGDVEEEMKGSEG